MKAVALVALLGLGTGALAQDAQPAFRQLMREGQRLNSVGNLRGASAKYAAAAEAATDDQERAEALVAHAVAQRGLERDDQAEADLRRAIALPGAGGFRRPAMAHLASLLEEQDRLDEAIKLYREVAAELRDSPEDAAEALVAAARLLAENGRWAEAREVVRGLRMEALPPHLKPEAAGLLLEVAIGSGDTDAAKAVIEGAGVEGSQLAQLYLRLARVLLDKGRADEALKACETAIEADPASGAAWRTQYDIAVAQGTADKLLDELQAKLRADPDDEVLLQRLASLAEWAEDPERGLAILRPLIELRPNDANLLERAGALAAQGGLGEEALGFYEAALRSQPDDPGLHNMIGEVHAKLGHKAEAVEAFKQGARYRPGDAESARRLGMVLMRGGMYEEAAAEYQAARRLLGDPNALAYELAEALAPVRPEEALGEYVRAASGSIEDAETVAPEAVKLARGADLLPRLAEMAGDRAQGTGDGNGNGATSPGLALIWVLTEAAQSKASEAVERVAQLGLAPQDLMVIGEALETQGDQEAAADAYAAVVAHPDASPGLKLELGVRAAEAQIAMGRPDEARSVLGAALREADGPEVLAQRAAFLLADLDLTAGRNLADARQTFARLAEASLEVRLTPWGADLSRTANWRLADVAFALGELDEAERMYGELAAEAPGLEMALPPPPPGLDLIPGRALLPPGVMMGDLPQPDPQTTPAYAASQIAECAFRKGDFDRAKALFAEVAEKYPDSVFANDAVERRLFISTHFSNPRPATEGYLAALTGALTDQWEVALVKLRGVAEAGLTEPLADDAALAIAVILESHGKLNEAAAQYRALPEAYPGSLLGPEALLSAARISRSSGDEPRAREDLNSLLRNYPTAPMAKTAALWLDDLDHGRTWPKERQ